MKFSFLPHVFRFIIFRPNWWKEASVKKTSPRKSFIWSYLVWKLPGVLLCFGGRWRVAVLFVIVYYDFVLFVLFFPRFALQFFLFNFRFTPFVFFFFMQCFVPLLFCFVYFVFFSFTFSFFHSFISPVFLFPIPLLNFFISPNDFSPLFAVHYILLLFRYYFAILPVFFLFPLLQFLYLSFVIFSVLFHVCSSVRHIFSFYSILRIYLFPFLTPGSWFLLRQVSLI